MCGRSRGVPVQALHSRDSSPSPPASPCLALLACLLCSSQRRLCASAKSRWTRRRLPAPSPSPRRGKPLLARSKPRPTRTLAGKNCGPKPGAPRTSASGGCTRAQRSQLAKLITPSLRRLLARRCRACSRARVEWDSRTARCWRASQRNVTEPFHPIGPSPAHQLRGSVCARLLLIVPARPARCQPNKVALARSIVINRSSAFPALAQARVCRGFFRCWWSRRPSSLASAARRSDRWRATYGETCKEGGARAVLAARRPLQLARRRRPGHDIIIKFTPLLFPSLHFFFTNIRTAVSLMYLRRCVAPGPYREPLTVAGTASAEGPETQGLVPLIPIFGLEATSDSYACAPLQQR